MKQIFGKAGWVFADEKETKPSQNFEYLGFIFDSQEMIYSIIEGKITTVEEEIKSLKIGTLVSLRSISRIVGKKISFELATTMLPRLFLHSYFRWIATTVCAPDDWNASRRIPKAVIIGLRNAISAVRKYSGKVRLKNYNYEEFEVTGRQKYENMCTRKITD